MAGNKETDQVDGREKEPRQKLVEDPHRPLYHFLPASSWMPYGG